jgi:uncharacterized membrane protein (UPF0136 family)
VEESARFESGTGELGMVHLAGVFALLYAAVSLVGGVLGALKGSTVSVVAGGAAAVLLAVGGWLTLKEKGWAPILVLVVSLALIGRFLPTYLKTSVVWPHLVMAVLGAVAAVLSVLAILAMRR